MMKGLKLFIVLMMGLIVAGCKAADPEKEPEITGSFSILASPSPNQVNIIELQEMYTKAEPGLHPEPEGSFFRIYHGEYGSMLENFVDIKDMDMPVIDYFDVVWTDDELVTINVIHRNEAGENFISESYELDFLSGSLEKQTN